MQLANLPRLFFNAVLFLLFLPSTIACSLLCRYTFSAIGITAVGTSLYIYADEVRAHCQIIIIPFFFRKNKEIDIFHSEVVAQCIMPYSCTFAWLEQRSPVSDCLGKNNLVQCRDFTTTLLLLPFSPSFSSPNFNNNILVSPFQPCVNGKH